MANRNIQRPSIHTEPYPAISEVTLQGSLVGQIAIITGAAGGLGKGESLSFARAGAKLALIDIPRASDALAAVKAECEKLTQSVKIYFCNVTDEFESAKTLAQIEIELGPVDILVNNAGA